MRIPIAHGDGNYSSDESSLDRLEEADQSPSATARLRADRARRNNGSARSIAGIYNASKTVLGLMRTPSGWPILLGGNDGRAFDGMVEALS